MEKNILVGSGSRGSVQFRLGNDFIFITEASKNEELSFREKDLILISYAVHPWTIQGCITYIEINFTYSADGRQKKKSIILNGLEKNATELLDFLQERYGEICRIKPTEKERAEMLSPAYSAAYGLHNLNVLTPLGVISGLLIIFVLVLYLMIATTARSIMPDPGRMNQAGIIIMILSLIPLGIMHLIATKRLMVAKTDEKGLTVRHFLLGRHCSWQKLTITAQEPSTHKVYRGLYCEASDHGEVVAAKALLRLSFACKHEKELKLSMPVDEAGRLFRELYYRNIISLEDAKQIGAFL
jgi:hypothetical protein